MEISINGYSGYVEPGRGVIIAAGDEHDFAASYENSFVVLDIPIPAAAFLGMPDRISGPQYFPMEENTEHLTQYFLRSRRRVDTDAEMRHSWSILILDSLGLSTRRTIPLNDSDSVLHHARRFIEGHFASPISVPSVAVAAGVSVTTLHVLFRKHLGTTPALEIARLRLNEAKRLLMSTDLPIAEIALATGHADQSTLTRRMRQLNGVTPAEVRKYYRS